MVCVHQQAPQAPNSPVALTTATVKVDMGTASPPVRVNTIGCYVVATKGHLTSPTSPAFLA